ncbi:MAG: phosphodiester glycosidase family protein, partial [Oscillospiraceae bacterium]|nr:phosphodiester glycosidase family protein [Oscillospiraceae bacterium]
RWAAINAYRAMPMPPRIPLDGPAPPPLASGWDGYNYHDDTIDMTYYTEMDGNTRFNFAEVKIGHPSQLRVVWSPEELKTTANLLSGQNAVVGVNGDFAKFPDRAGGVIFRQGVLYRNQLLYADLLIIDKYGDFHIIKEEELAGGFNPIDSFEIINSFHFGPGFIIDGVMDARLNNGVTGAYWATNPRPRTAIGQIGPLHYLFVCVEGGPQTDGCGVEKMARAMYDKGCVQAYNLDGGYSTAMVIGEERVSAVWGEQRALSEAIYFASAQGN